ncbi:hypothetical protein [Aeromonas veronii]|uniref:hypothetical protein n=1 Tax=Aeromonas veronii TaxID=654 RepID=UPI001E47E3DD|nr:hypothetical protein [Aeromonas veronii]MCD6619937.1 hypothetical protein [Aeromonas veronii]
MTLTPGKSHLTALDILFELRCWLEDNVQMQAEPAIVAHLPNRLPAHPGRLYRGH